MIAEGWTMGLNAGSSVPEGGCSFTFMTCGQEGRTGTASPGFSSPSRGAKPSLPASSSSGGPGALSFGCFLPRGRERPRSQLAPHLAWSHPALRGGRYECHLGDS